MAGKHLNEHCDSYYNILLIKSEKPWWNIKDTWSKGDIDTLLINYNLEILRLFMMSFRWMREKTE